MKKRILSTLMLCITALGFAQVNGDILINEFLPDPNGTENQKEWFEIWNTTASDIDIEGWTIRDRSSSSRWHLIANGGPLIVPANGYLVLGTNTDTGTNGGINVDYAYNFVSQSPFTTVTATGFPSFNNSNSFDDGVDGCNSTVDTTGGISDNEKDGVRLLMPDMSTPMDPTDFIEIDRLEYDYGYNADNLVANGGSGQPIGIPYLPSIPGWNDGYTQLEGSGCFMGNEDLDNNRSIQRIGTSGVALDDWAFSNDVNVAGEFFGTPGAANNNVLSTDKFTLDPDNFDIFPNPATNILTIRSDKVVIESISLFDILGKNVFTGKEMIDDGIDVSNIASGLYVLKVTANNSSLVKRIVIN
ncbi:T9SS type A sorting domain-containing protein [Sungkyunkwania multivorans]|uniref:T9SS type A sorting domain-containing protein n=1 Tax=Sungkyunkwania multivorans TaxID=1173618 RepID=A0ABW3CWC8_9FLAO